MQVLEISATKDDLHHRLIFNIFFKRLIIEFERCDG